VVGIGGARQLNGVGIRKVVRMVRLLVGWGLVRYGTIDLVASSSPSRYRSGTRGGVVFGHLEGRMEERVKSGVRRCGSVVCCLSPVKSMRLIH